MRAPKPANETLDFQEILYISMPYRTDRQDALALLAAETGLRLTMIPGISTDDMSEKGLPVTNNPTHDPHWPWVGIWRAHANAWRYIIDNDLGSTLILEDDVDWDVYIKDVMGLLNWQMRYNNTIPRHGRRGEKESRVSDCAYGCDYWDTMFVGQCQNSAHPDDLRHMTYHDPYSPAVKDTGFVGELKDHWNLTEEDASVRVLAPTFNPLCLQAYALSNLGARRALYQIGGFHSIHTAVDVEMIEHLESGQLAGYTVTPPPFVKWGVHGRGETDNFYQHFEDQLEEEKDKDLDRSMAGGWSSGLMTSARKALGVLGAPAREWEGVTSR
ncbi:hypothetical protein BDV96DRAFT_687040 [Lophiotrema nucula]|uniref:Glycosyltransferase family 25 protein n=1 Tax=Lophiotrema nucula TaxID=690887 RepID=A0A6A5ZBU3_9PLEO|nr:hypothetical protein BDV96DRAFT_687040 [Lophiotrema nucula]